MNNFLSYLKRTVALLLGVFLFSFGVSGALASTTPTQVPSASYKNLIPNFRAVLVGSGTDPEDEGNLNVSGNMTTVGDLLTDSFDTYSASQLNVTGYITAPNFGDVYFVNSSGYTSAGSGIYTATASCTHGDYIVGCTGEVGSPSSTKQYYGSIATYSGATIFTKRYVCTTYGSTSSVTAQAACFAPSDEQGTNSSGI